MGQSGFVQEHVTAVVDSVIAQISKLQGLSEMPVQVRLLLLRKSQQLKTAHFMRCVENELLQEPLAKLEQSVRDMFLSLIDRQHSEVDIDQLYLPLRFGGVGCSTGHQNQVLCAKRAISQPQRLHNKHLQMDQLHSSRSRERGLRSLTVTGYRSRHS